jgi:hypothetical protein
MAVRLWAHYWRLLPPWATVLCPWRRGPRREMYSFANLWRTIYFCKFVIEKIYKKFLGLPQMIRWIGAEWCLLIRYYSYLCWKLWPSSCCKLANCNVYGLILWMPANSKRELTWEREKTIEAGCGCFNSVFFSGNTQESCSYSCICNLYHSSVNTLVSTF